jgi:ABC-type transporter Mla maintaining outer membrane lipid asymmetry ATPase subunit MlaF
MSFIQSLELKSMNFGYSNSQDLFSNVSFNLPLGSFVLIQGESVGAGCSTLLQILAGLIPSSERSYYINNQPISDMSFEEFLPYRLKIGLSFDYGGLLHNRTLLENLTLPLLYHKICSYDSARDIAKSYLDKLSASSQANIRPSQVQGSLRKATVLLRSLIMNPEVLLLDEPSQGLSDLALQSYLNLVLELRGQGFLSTVVINSNDQRIQNFLKEQESCKKFSIRERQIYEA